MTEADKKISARARVSLTIEVDVGGGAWGGECTVAQVHKQALDGARNRMSGLLQKERDIRIVGEMQVTMISSSLGQ